MPDPGYYHSSANPRLVGPWLLPLTGSFGTLAYMADADVIPLTVRWNESTTGLVFEVEEPLNSDVKEGLDCAEFEEAMLDAYVNRMSAWLEKYPEQIQYQRMRRMDEETRKAVEGQSAEEEPEESVAIA